MENNIIDMLNDPGIFDKCHKCGNLIPFYFNQVGSIGKITFSFEKGTHVVKDEKKR